MALFLICSILYIFLIQDIYIDISDAFDIEVKSSEVGFLDRPVRTLICTKMTV